jgi:MFS family permease
VNVALPHIQSGLHLSSGGLSWVLNAYILTFGGLLLLGARAGDLIGRRRSFLTGIALFSVSSMAGGLATTGSILLAARALQGLGAALAAPAALSLLTTRFAEGAERVRAIALYTTVSAAGGAIGLVAGGLLTELASWRWVMFVNVPIGVAVWLVGRQVLVETPRRTGRFDLLGAATSTLGMTAIVLGLVEAGSDGWISPVTIGSLVGGALLLALFLRTEARAAEPVLPLRLFSNATRNTANAARALIYAGMYGMFFFLSQFLQDVASRVLVRRLPQRAVMLTGGTLAAASLLLATRLQAGSTYGQIAVSLVLMGAGAGISFVSLTSASLADVAPEDAGAASGLINVSQQIGAALGLAVLVSAFSALSGHVQLGGPIRLAASHLHSLVTGLDDVFTIGALFTLAALVLIAVKVRPPVSQPAVVAVETEWEVAA